MLQVNPGRPCGIRSARCWPLWGRSDALGEALPVRVRRLTAKKRKVHSASVVAALLLNGLMPWGRADEGRPAVRVDLLADPLWSMPEALGQGVQLPGSTSPLVCRDARDPAAELTLVDAVHLALCANPRVQAAWIAIKTQASSLGLARSAYLPKVNASARRLRDTTWTGSAEQAAPTERRGTSASLSLVWRLLDFGARSGNVQTANDLVAAALATHDAALQQTMAAVIQAYFDAQAAQALLSGRQKSLDVARSTLDAARRRQAAGPGSASESLQAKTAMARAMLEVGRAEGGLAQAKVALAQAVGIPAESMIRLPELAVPDGPELGRALASWLADARTAHPAITAARLQEKAAHAQVRAARGEGLPSLDLVLSYYRNGRPEQGLTGVASREWQAGIVLNIPLFEGFERTYRIRGAEAVAELRGAELREAEQRVAAEVAQAYAGVAAALKGLEASDVLLESATASQVSSSRRYQHGVADVLEVLSTQQALADAHQQRSRSIAEWYSASLRMAAAAGLLGLAELRSQEPSRDPAVPQHTSGEAAISGRALPSPP